jgi:hypothetical protein
LQAIATSAASNQPASIIDRHRVANGLAKETVGFVGLNPMGLLVAEKMKTRANISFSIVYDRDADKVYSRLQQDYFIECQQILPHFI